MKKNQLPTLTTLSLHTGRLWNGRLVHKPPQPQLATRRAALALCIIHQKTGPLRF
jgi:hypothetical protein